MLQLLPFFSTLLNNTVLDILGITDHIDQPGYWHSRRSEGGRIPGAPFGQKFNV